jgi:hypothetical protein
VYRYQKSKIFINRNFDPLSTCLHTGWSAVETALSSLELGCVRTRVEDHHCHVGTQSWLRRDVCSRRR